MKTYTKPEVRVTVYTAEPVLLKSGTGAQSGTAITSKSFGQEIKY